MDPFGGIFPGMPGISASDAAIGSARMKLHFILESAEMNLRNRELSYALQGYKAALDHCWSCRPILEDEVQSILSRRSFIHYELNDGAAALNDARACIQRDQSWAEGYLRAALAFKSMNKPYKALEHFMQSYELTLQYPSPNHCRLEILTELIIMITRPQRHRGICEPFLKCQGQLNPGTVEEQVNLLKSLADRKCWEGVSLLVTGKHRGLQSSLDFSSANCPAKHISVGKLLQELSTEELKEYGMQLAVALFKNGALFEEIEKIWNRPTLHVIVLKVLETGHDELLMLTFRKYLDSKEKKDVVDMNGNSVLHVIVQFNFCEVERKNTVLARCLQNGCSPFVFDKQNKLPIELCKEDDLCYNTLAKASKDAATILSAVIDLKNKGNKATSKGDNEEALNYYTKALRLSENSENIDRERAILYTNRCTVLSNINALQEALENAEMAISTDKTWSKGHWRKSHILRMMGRYLEAFETSMIGQNLPDISRKDKIDILVEGMKSFQSLLDSEKTEKYEELTPVSADLWPSVLGILSKQGEWLCIKELVLGLGSNSSVVAKNVDFSTISYSTLIPFLVSKPELDRKSSGVWLNSLIVHMLLSDSNDHKNLFKFKENEADTPLHFAARLSVITENTCLLQHMVETSQKLSFTNGIGDSPLHSIINMPRPTETDLFLEVVKILIRYGVSPDIRNREGRSAIDCVNRTREPNTFLLLRTCKEFDQDAEPANNLEKVEKQADLEVPKSVPETTEVENSSTNSSIDPNTDGLKEDKTQLFRLNRNAGDKAFKKKEFKDAISFYDKATVYIKDSTNIERIRLFCNMADCLHALKRYQDIIEREKLFPEMNQFVEVQLRIGKAYMELKKFKQGFLKLTRASKRSSNSQVTEDILYEMAKCYSKGERKDLGIRDLENVTGYCHWIKILLKLMQNDEWLIAGQFFICLSDWTQAIHNEEFDLKPLCDINKLQQHKWIIDLILNLLEIGSDYHKLYIEKGESFLHACVRITLATGNPNLLLFVLHKAALKNEQNIQDSHDNTALHLAVNTRVIGAMNHSYQMFVVQRLLEARVNPLIQNRQKKMASKCVSKSFPEIKECIKAEEKKRQIAIEKQDMDRRQQEENRRKQQQEEKRRQKEEREHHKKLREEKRNSEFAAEECRSKCSTFLRIAKGKIQADDIRSACHEMQKIFQMTRHKLDTHKQIENEALTLIINAFGRDKNPDIPDRLTRIPMKTYRRIVLGLAEKGHWKQMHIAVIEYRKRHDGTGLNDFAEGLSVTQVIKCDQLQESKDLLTEIIDSMLNSGATLMEGGKLAIELAVQTNNFKVLKRLFDHGANPIHLSVESGDTPIHAALHIALERDKGNTSLLDMFLETHTCSPCLDPSQLNMLGESLFHVVAKTKFTETTYEVTRILCEKGVKSNIKDSEGKLPVDYLKNKNDRRLQYFRLASRGGTDNVNTIDKCIKEESSQFDSNTSKSDTQTRKQMERLAPVTQIKKQKLREEIINMIRELKDISMYSDELMSKSRKKKDTNTNETDNPSFNEIFDKKENMETSSAKHRIHERSVIDEDKIEMETGFFDNSEWEIECTSHVWEKMMGIKLTRSVLKGIIETMQQFAKGVFTFDTCETIKPGGLFQTIEILESGPVIWEIAVCFSPRLTDAGEHSKNVYTETVRVWDIFETAEEKEDSLKTIKESYLRGSECMIEKFITCSDKCNVPCFDGKQRLPRKYIDCSISDINTKNAQKMIFPASHLATEYHILKFYSLTTEMAKCALQSVHNQKDFPFKVTEVEHSIINLCSTSPILLLGRSGTGKTTCCLYRLYHRYSRCLGVKEGEFHGEEDEIPIDSPPHNIRQLFVTKNLVLCNEVQKTFCEMRNATRNTGMENTEEKAIPERFDDFRNEEFPVFLTSKKLLLIIDGSLPNPFFKRDSSGKLLDDVPGWSNDDDSLSVLPKLDDDSDSESEISDEETYFDDMDDTDTQPRKSCVRREVTYDIFANLVWPKIRKGFEDYHPSLVWMEIISIIKGSYEALVQTSGCLNKDDYIEQGQKKAPNFTGKREQIYDIFLKYRHFIRQRFWFDEADVVNDIFHRIRREKIDSWNIQEIYVDETQDFTQAELYLLLRICKNPNNMFLTGDTAQSIMRGISFRFKDLRSLFYHASQRVKDVNIPEKIHQLTHNYRSHTGVLYLASSVLDLLVEFFPESFDILQSDQGLFNGPSPVLLEICERSDLAVLLKGKGKSTSRIEFGAHQAVLVANDAARENLPDALRQGIVLTIYEAKGLEFDDILLYNFFKDSQAKKEWRVVTQLLETWHNEKSNETKPDSAAKCKSIVEIDYNVLMESDRPRPLAFDPSKHKVLNTDLKQLYTAITRARVNVWIFDESEETRAPMFEYFKARKLVQTIKDSETGGNLGFAEVSTPEEWIMSGEKFMAKSLFNTAATCFREGGDHYKENIAKCHQKALEASRMHDAPTLMKELFLSAAHDFLEYEKPSEAGKCLENAKEWNLAADLYKKTNQLVKASEIYIKMRLPLDGSKCLEEAGQFKRAIKLLCDHGFFEAAIDCLHRYKIWLKGYTDKGKPIPWKLTENAPDSYLSEEKLSLMAANLYLQQGQIQKMKTFLDRLPNIMDRVDFLVENDRIKDTIAILRSFGKPALLIEFYLNQGMTEEALDCAEHLGDVSLKNKCHVMHGMIKSSDLSTLKEIEKEEICEKLKKVFYVMHDSSDKDLAGRVALVIGKIEHNQIFVQKAYGSFENCTPYASLAGELECMHWMTLNSDLCLPVNISKCILGMQTLYKALNILMRPINDAERNQRGALLDFYGFHQSKKDGVLRVYPQQKPLALQMVCNLDRSKHVCSVKLSDGCKNIFKFLAGRGFLWQSRLENQLLRTLNTTQQHTILKRLDARIRCIELEMHIRVGAEELQRRGTFWDKELGSLKHVPFYAHCECILKDIFEENGRMSFASMQDSSTQSVLSVLRKPHNRFFHKAIESYMQPLTHFQSEHWKENHLSSFLRLIFSHDVFGARLHIDPAKVLEQINETVNREMLMSMKDNNKLEAVKAFGFEVHALDEDKQTSTISSICIRMLHSQKFLRDLNFVQAAIEFGTFCRELSHCDIDLLPCFSQLLCWLEFYLTMFFILSTLLLSKPNDKEAFRIVLPDSYYKHTLTLGYVFCDNDNVLQKITKFKRDAKANEAAYLQTLPCMLTLLCGEKMNLFDLIFNCDNDSKDRKDEKGVFAERLLVLCLVVFCNLRDKLKDAKEIEKNLAMKLFSLIRNRRKLRLSNSTLMPILRKWRKNDTNLFSDILYEILQKRENYNLDYLSGLRVDVKGDITEEKINDTTSLRKKNFMNKETYTVIGIPQKDKRDNSEPQSKDNRGTTSERNTNTSVDLSKAGKTVSECTVSGHENKTDTNTEEPRKIPESKEEAAKNVIVRCMKKIIFRKKYGKMNTHLKQFIAEEKDKAIKELFKEQRENTAMCGVCGVHYINSEECSEMETSLHGEQSNPTDQQATENNKQFKRAEEIGSPSAASSRQEDSMLNENPFSLLLSNSTNVPEQEYAKDHLNGDAHRLKKMEYDDFRNKVCTEIYEVMRSVKRFIGIYNLRGAKDEVYKIYSTQIETLCSEHDDIELSINLIIKGKDWTNIDIDSKVQALLETFQIVKDGVLKIAKDLKQKRKDEAGKEAEEQNKKTPKRKKLRYKEKFVFSAS